MNLNLIITIFIILTFLSCDKSYAKINWKPKRSCATDKFRCPAAYFKCIRYPKADNCEVVKVTDKRGVKSISYDNWCEIKGIGKCAGNYRCETPLGEKAVMAINPYRECSP